MRKEPNRFEAAGCWLSERVSEISAHPFAQILVLIVCVAWFMGGFRVDILTAGLSILAITLTQMVLNKQEAREAEAHRRDVALHAKLDELVHASFRARDELAGIEELEEEEIAEIRENGNVAKLPVPRLARLEPRKAGKQKMARKARDKEGRPARSRRESISAPA